MDQIRTILVVDDDPDVCDAVSSYLSEDEYRIVTASRWTEAIATLQEDRPDAVLLDLHLPTVQGEALLEFIRETDRNLPIVILSAEAKPGEMTRLGELGASGFIRKPFETDDLLVVLEQVLVDLAILSEETSQSSSPDSEEEKDPIDAELGPDIVPGAGVFDLQRQRTSSPLETPAVTATTTTRRRRGRSKKRGRALRGTRMRRLRNYALMMVFFVLIASLIYAMREGLNVSYLAGITFNKNLPEQEVLQEQ